MQSSFTFPTFPICAMEASFHWICMTRSLTRTLGRCPARRCGLVMGWSLAGNGTSWSAGGNLSGNRGYAAGIGSQTAGLVFGGTAAGGGALSSSEEYDGTSWSAGGSLSAIKQYLAGCGRFSAPTFKEKLLKAVEYDRKMFSGKTVENQSDGGQIIISLSGIKHSGSGQVSEVALAVFEKLDELIATTGYVGSAQDKNGRSTIKEVRFYERDVLVDGAPARVRVVVPVAADGSRYYDHFELRGQEKATAGQSGKQDEPDSLQPFTGATQSADSARESLTQTKKEPQDLDSMLDEVLAEETGGAVSQEKPKTEREAKERQPENREFLTALGAARKELPTGYEIQSEGKAISLMENGVNAITGINRSVAGVQEALRQAKLRASKNEQRTAKEAAASAAKNTAEGFNNAIDGLGKLFGGEPGTFGSGPVFNEETYKKAKPLFQAAVANFSQAGSDIKDVMRAVIKAVLDKFGKQVTENMKPYIVRFVKDYQEEQSGAKTEPTLAAVTDLYKPEGKMKVAQELADFFIGGVAFSTIVDARKKIGEMIGKPIEAATELAKQADETVEVAVVLAAREIIKAGRAQKRSSQVIYDRMAGSKGTDSLTVVKPNIDCAFRC